MSKLFNLPPTNEHPDNTYFNTDAISYEFEVDGQRATRGFIQPEFSDIFPVSDGGENITFVNPIEGAELSIQELGEDGETEAIHVLNREGDSVSIPGGKNMRVSTGKAVVEYICIYPGQASES